MVVSAGTRFRIVVYTIPVFVKLCCEHYLEQPYVAVQPPCRETPFCLLFTRQLAVGENENVLLLMPVFTLMITLSSKDEYWMIHESLRQRFLHIVSIMDVLKTSLVHATLHTSMKRLCFPGATQKMMQVHSLANIHHLESPSYFFAASNACEMWIDCMPPSIWYNSPWARTIFTLSQRTRSVEIARLASDTFC